MLSCAESAVLLSTAKTVVLPTRRVFSKHSTYALQPCLCRRALSTPVPHINHSDLSIERYHALADVTMTSLLERLENLLDEIANEGFEVDYHSGVLTLNLGSNGTYVINKQPPNKQIWLSSPISGPKRYDYVPSTDDWRYSRDGEEMAILLEQELSRAFGREVNLGLGRVSEAVE
ncbi:Frataxin [Imleria badia]|nr:Frataxin [Imleria badia]